MWFLIAIAAAAPEICDGIDNDGDGSADEGPVLAFADTDGDGQGDAFSATVHASCALVPLNQVSSDQDCDDSTGAVFEGATEVCNGVDDDCDGQIDESGCSSTLTAVLGDSTYQLYNPGSTWLSARDDCEATGYILPIVESAAENTWLRDLVNPYGIYLWLGLEDFNDDGVYVWIDGSPLTYDNFPFGEPDNNDCVYEGAVSSNWYDWPCNAFDNTTWIVCEVECTQRTWYADTDGDGFGNNVSTTTACVAPAGYVANDLDCNDGASAIHPTATEVCGGGDEDCNPATTGVDVPWYLDGDSDGYGDLNDSVLSCTQPAGRVADSSDCDDSRADANPGAAEDECDGVDEDCDGQIDEGLTSPFFEDHDEDGLGSTTVVQACSLGVGLSNTDDDCDDTNPAVLGPSTWYFDGDDDLFGVTSSTVTSCFAPVDHVPAAGDCDDLRADVYPAAPELCDEVDNDCDTDIDEGVQSPFYVDADGDGLGSTTEILACGEGPNVVANPDDCDDSNAAVGAALTWYQNADGDGYGDDAQATTACSAPLDHIAVGGDCNDADPTAYPGATEVCDGDLEDCNGTVDQGLQSAFWLDSDSDGYGDASGGTLACTAPTGFVDNDLDCNDTDQTAFPGAVEVCDGDLETCGGVVDDGVTTTFYRDADNDGHGDPSITNAACALPGGFALAADDCNDSEPLAWEGAVEVCDGVDNDCSGAVDEGVQTTFWRDTDNDSYGDAANEVLACSQPAGTATNDQDCDDGRGEAYPGAPELCNNLDDDCDLVVDNGTNDVQWYVDGDGDGVGDAVGAFQCEQPTGQVSLFGDCDDTDPDVRPGVHELCDHIDNDCDGTTDVDAVDASTWFTDSDADGFGETSSAVVACVQPSGAVAVPGDCDDAVAAVNPHATEICDGIDNNCDGQTDLDAPNPTLWYPDADGDAYGDETGTPLAQCAQPSGYVQDATDCDDAVFGTNPGALEQCDLVDHDCDGNLDNDTMDRQYYLDTDGDGYGSSDLGHFDCAAAPGEVANSDDCDDTNALVSPAGTEVCNGIDDDCDGTVDADAVVGTDTWYLDLDDDGYGDPDAPVTACTQPSNAVADATDCDDTTDLVSPVAPEICDGADNDCNGTVDEGLATSDWYPDLDGDGFGDSDASPTTACGPASGEVADHSDCDDADAGVYPGALDVPDNGVDEDCDGSDATGPPPPTPTDPVETADTGDPADGAPARVLDAGCACDASGERPLWTGWLRR